MTVAVGHYQDTGLFPSLRMAPTTAVTLSAAKGLALSGSLLVELGDSTL